MRYSYILLLLALSFSAAAQYTNKPKLVVGIVVDQMRQDYIYRYWDKYSDNGIKKLVSEGFEYKNAHFNYVPTYTGPGHSSIYSGTTPSRHGVIANSWYDRETGNVIYCTVDSSASPVGGSGSTGYASAFNLKTTTVTDELRMFSNDRSKVVGVAIKDRGSVFPAGHHPTGAYWYDDRSGEFISSTYYVDSLPEWVNDFNLKDYPQQYAAMTWEALMDTEEYVESGPDSTGYERSLDNGPAMMPYDLSIFPNGLGIITYTPFGNTLTTDFAFAAIDGESLGKDEITDFLAISYSSTDRAGHAFGPRAVEMEDMYLRFDKEIERLLNYLDKEIGEEEYVIFLTADHGVSDVPNFYRDNQYPGGYFHARGTANYVSSEVSKILGDGDWIINVSNDQIFLNRELIFSKGMDLRKVQNDIANIIIQFDFVHEVLLSEDLKTRNLTDPFLLRFQNGFNTQLSGDLIVVTKSGYLSRDAGTKGTTHGSGYNYDTQVPVIFYGKGIGSGNSVRQVSITDIAPTISVMLDIPLPSAATGQPLKELFE